MASAGTQTTRLEVSPASDGRLLAALAEIDSRIRELDRAWKAVVRQLDASRRELAVVAAQLQRARSLAARAPRREDDASPAKKQVDIAHHEEAHQSHLLEQFEARLKEAETQRLALHRDAEGWRRRQQAALRELPAGARSAYEAALKAGRVPAIATMTGGVCGECASDLTPSVVEAVSRGAVVVCGRCERLLCPSP